MQINTENMGNEVQSTLDWFNKVDFYNSSKDLKKVTNQLRCHLEETQELIDAYVNMDFKELVDALGDSLVTLLGLFSIFNVSPEETLKQINISNYSKFDKNNNPMFTELGKLKKSTNFREPNLKELSRNQLISPRPRILICGFAGSGKTTVGKLLSKEFLFRRYSATKFILENGLFEHLKSLGHEYDDINHCYRLKTSSRKEYKEYFDNLIKNAPTEFTKEFLDGYSDIYEGMRNVNQFEACKKERVFDLSIWVDAVQRTEFIDSKLDNEITPSMCDVVLDNNGTKEDLLKEVERIYKDFILNV